MPKIVFRGKTYNSVFDMPNDVREAYQIEKRRSTETNTTTSNASKPLTEFVEMSDEIREIYERALGNVEQRPASSRPLSELPKTEDIYKQSAPSGMKHLPSDESVYQPSPSPLPPLHSVIEPDNGTSRLVWTVILLALLAVVAFVVTQYML